MADQKGPDRPRRDMAHVSIAPRTSGQVVPPGASRPYPSSLALPPSEPIRGAEAQQPGLAERLADRTRARVDSPRPTGRITRTDENGVAWKELSTIGEGGMGVVYLAEDPKGTQAALKVIRPGEITVKSFERLAKEIRAHLDLRDHPNIVQYISCSLTDPDTSFFVMELVKGSNDFKKYLAQKGPLKPKDYQEGCSLISQFINGLAFMHEKGLVHRDIKPSNIFVTDDGKAKLGDLGLALRDHTVEGVHKTLSSRLTDIGHYVGTLGYAAPEQFTPVVCTTRADIYALGVVLYETFCGKLPIDEKKKTLEKGLSPQTAKGQSGDRIEPLGYIILKSTGYADIKRPNDVRKSLRLPRISEQLEDVIMRSLNPNPDARPKLEEIKAALLNPKPSRRNLAIGAAVLSVAAALSSAIIVLQPQFFKPASVVTVQKEVHKPVTIKFIVPAGTDIIGPDNVKHSGGGKTKEVTFPLVYPYSTTPVPFTFRMPKKSLGKTIPDVDLSKDGEVRVSLEEFRPIRSGTKHK